MKKKCQKINLQEPQRNRNATANFVNLIRTSTVPAFLQIRYVNELPYLIKSYVHVYYHHW